MKFVTHKKTGKRYCLHCSSYDCICLPESEEYFDLDFASEVEVKDRYDLFSGKSNKFWFYKQKLSNGRVIESNSELIVPTWKWNPGDFKGRQTIYLSNDIINQSFH